MATFEKGIWGVDFEFHPSHGQAGDKPLPVCMVATEFHSGRTLRLWQDDLLATAEPPFPVGDDVLFVSFFASAELNCFMALGWPVPANILDLFAEFRCHTNGTTLIAGAGLLGALQYFGLPASADAEKTAMRDLILSRGPWTQAQRMSILEYCAADVEALHRLFDEMQRKGLIDWPRALLRGQYMAAVADMEFRGIPIEISTLSRLGDAWGDIVDRLIFEVDQAYGVYEGSTFVTKKFEDYLAKSNIPWPRHSSGALRLDKETFKDMAKAYPALSQLRELRATLAQMRLSELGVGVDGRNRCLLSPFKSVTGRNQPSTSRFIFGPAVWLRCLIQPQAGHALAYIDWSQQEFGIAAALSNDQAMLAAYKSGDPYLAFAKQAGAVPESATKASHKAVRDQFKACVLAVQYGMGVESLAVRINQPVVRAQQLLDLHRRTFPAYWAFVDSATDQASLGGELWTTLGWKRTTSAGDRETSLRNWPMQSTGAELLRVACILLREAGIGVCAPVHDAILIEAPIEVIEPHVELARNLMRQASRGVLGNLELETDVVVVRHPERYVDERGAEMWQRILRLLDDVNASRPLAA